MDICKSRVENNIEVMAGQSEKGRQFRRKYDNKTVLMEEMKEECKKPGMHRLCLSLNDFWGGGDEAKICFVCIHLQG